MSPILSTLLSSVSSMSDEDLRKVNSLVVSEIKHRHDRKQHLAKAALKVGDSVQFMSKYGMQKGVITRFKQKTVEVQVGHVRWTVTATLLSKV